MKKSFGVILFALAACIVPPRQQLRIVGSSTVYPFVASAAEQFARNTDFPTPIVESTGTGGGFQLFCGGVGAGFPDIANASRPIKPAEREACAKNGVKDLREIPIGFDGIVIASSHNAAPVKMTREALFLALAKEVPDKSGLVANPYKTWHDVSMDLPDVEIAVYGPPTTSGTRDAFVELVMQEECVKRPEFVAAYASEAVRKEKCGVLREDGHYIDAGENDNIIVQKLKNNNAALGIFGYSFLQQNLDTMRGNSVDGKEPTFENVASGSYKISRSLYIYIKQQHRGLIPGLDEFVAELTSPAAIGPEGYLIGQGLIPLPSK